MTIIILILVIAFGVPAFLKLIKILPYILIYPFIIIGLLFVFTIKSFPILSKKWWAWLIQFPILFLQIIVFLSAYMENKIGLGIFFVFVFQIIASTIIFNIQRIIQKDY